MTTQATENKGESATNEDESFTTTTRSETTPNNVVRTRSGRIVKPQTCLNYIELNVCLGLYAGLSNTIIFGLIYFKT
jgi:hypothetical protein